MRGQWGELVPLKSKAHKVVQTSVDSVLSLVAAQRKMEGEGAVALRLESALKMRLVGEGAVLETADQRVKIMLLWVLETVGQGVTVLKMLEEEEEGAVALLLKPALFLVAESNLA